MPKPEVPSNFDQVIYLFRDVITAYPNYTDEQKRQYWRSLPDIISCLSVRPPWAQLILGKHPDHEVLRPVEHRSWLPNKELPFYMAIHASKTVDVATCKNLRIDPETLETGVILGIVKVMAVFAYTPELWEYLADLHYEEGDMPMKDGEAIYGWITTNPIQLAKPVPRLGQLGLKPLRKEDLLAK